MTDKLRSPKDCAFTEGDVRCQVKVDRHFEYNQRGIAQVDLILNWLREVRGRMAERREQKREARGGSADSR